MTLLEPQPDAQPGSETPSGAPEPAAQTPLCKVCSAPMAADQDWCLSCGQAAPGRLARLPGMRAAGVIAAMALVLIGGAVAAAYAALSDSSSPSSPTQLAQVQSTPTVATPPAATTPTTPAATTGRSSSSSTPPSSGAPSASELDHITDDLPSSSGTSSPPSTPTFSSSTSSGSSSSGTTTSSSTGDSPSTTTTTATTPTAPKPIALEDADVAAYDPYTRATAQGDVRALLDDDPATSWFFTAPAGSPKIGAGLTVDLGHKRGIREIDLITRTPGFKAEVYATDSDELPPNVLDTRWAHIHNVDDVASTAGRPQRILLGAGTTKYRHLLLWITDPPKSGLTVRVSSLSVLG